MLVRVSWKVDLGSSGYRLFGGFLFVLQLLLHHDKNFLNNFEQKFTYLFNLAASLFLHLKTNAIYCIYRDLATMYTNENWFFNPLESCTFR